MDIEAAGGLITAGLVAGAIEKPTGEAGEHDAQVCPDCGAATSGKFCSNCGQPTHVHRTLLHLGEEVLHGVMHFDARVWRTLPLLAFNPGRLTREWIHGKRTRYVSPLAMFLFTVFVTFFALSFVHMPEATFRPLDPSVAAEGAEDFAEGRRDIAAARAEATTAADKVVLDAADNVMATVADQAATRGQPRPDGLTPGSWQANVHDIAASVYADPDTGPGLKKWARKLMNPDLAVYKVQQTSYKFAFLLVPLSIPFLALLFLWRRRTTLYDHGVFVLYSLTFVTLAALLVAALSLIHPALGGVAGTILVFGVPVHQFAQLKGGYELGVFSTLWRWLFLQVFCVIVASLFIATVLWLAVGV